MRRAAARRNAISGSKYRLKLEAGFFIITPDILKKNGLLAIHVRGKERTSALT